MNIESLILLEVVVFSFFIFLFTLEKKWYHYIILGILVVGVSYLYILRGCQL